MALTPEQKATLKTFILAHPDIGNYPNSIDGAADFAAQKLNILADPAFIVWRTSVTRGEILQNGFDWTRLDNLSVGKARVWNDIFVDGQLNPAKANVRAGIESVWVGTQADLDVRAAVYVHCKESATVGEKLFATGTGTTVSPATRVVVGSISYQDVHDARNLA
jgi:hypothetical protein